MATIGYSISSIPQDLLIGILIRLPAKSLFRFRCVSKSWLSIITSQQFINAFMSLSLTRPRLVVALVDGSDHRMYFFSSPHQSCSALSSSSMVVAERYNLLMPKATCYFNHICNSVRGFVCCRHGNWVVVCNLTTGQVIHLIDMNYDNYNFNMYLGYDPNSDQYKVLRIMSPKLCNSHVEHSVRTLGGQQSSNLWKPIKTNIIYYCLSQDSVCIDGVVYYKCGIKEQEGMIGCFDVGSELLRLIEIPEAEIFKNDLTDYLGKLAVYHSFDNGFRLWVLDDVKNQVWSKKTYSFQSFTSSMFSRFDFRGVTASGEIVYVPFIYVARCDSDSLELLCCDAETKMEKKVKIEGISKIGRFHPFILSSYVENIVYL